MNGYLALRVIAYFALGIGIGILTHPAWGFIAFGVLILLDNLVLGRYYPVIREVPRDDDPDAKP
jgi:hypothetical protein